jgi:regulator of RNase E activity RraA
MEHTELSGRCATLSTPLIADACLRLKHPLRLAPFGISPILPDQMLVGRALPVRHYGSVDIFLEAMLSSEPGDVLVIDNAGRTDEACAGDLTALEAKANKLEGIIIWGCHRDTRELVAIGFPVFSYGRCSTGPQRLDRQDPRALISANFGSNLVTKNDVVFADEDGVLFVSSNLLTPVITAAEDIRNKERKQADAVQNGFTLSKQLKFDEYLRKRNEDRAYTFRDHLRKIGGAIEE